jgi:hypothetical protein
MCVFLSLSSSKIPVEQFVITNEIVFMIRVLLKKSSITTVVILFYTLTVSAQSEGKSEQAKLSSAELKEDFALARQILETIHPALYDFVSKEKLTNEFDSPNKLLNQELSVLDFY